MGTNGYKKLWKIAWAMWENRNRKEHEDKTLAADAVRKEVETEISLGTQNICKLRGMFLDSEIVKARGNNVSYSRAWVRQVRSVRKREI
jgi:hypothetical protein